ncbi:hypothetical protein K0M31_017540 [Melipona bicolor]|uniref:Uncharacterized protein n=1 Tax=Melipona bicolor TaxID=60889 RepID=A0AA40G528_9HYME|nr:hypothetical protein K0M31_017540 [Melipona bicolor]
MISSEKKKERKKERKKEKKKEREAKAPKVRRKEQTVEFSLLPSVTFKKSEREEARTTARWNKDGGKRRYESETLQLGGVVLN